MNSYEDIKNMNKVEMEEYLRKSEGDGGMKVMVKCIQEYAFDKNAFTVDDGIYQSLGRIVVINNYGKSAAYPEHIFEYVMD